MMKFILLAIFIALELSLVHSINWQPGNWAMGCDFNVEGNNLAQKNGPGKDCSSNCQFKYGCTHFVHVGGVCYMKKGSVSKNDAIDTGDQKFVCGIIKESSGSGPRPQPGPQPGTPITGSWPGCQFKWGTDWDGKNPNKDYSNFDYITFWWGSLDATKGTDFNEYWEGLYLNKVKQTKKIPVIYGYIIAFEARHKAGLWDCNDRDHPDPNVQLCRKGANWIRKNWQLIKDRYKMHAVEMASAKYLGPNAAPIILVEPDLYQYYHNREQEGGPLSGNELRKLYDEICMTIKSVLPNAKFSWDISPWANNEMPTWWGYFSDSNYVDFIHTSGGGHLASNNLIDPNNQITYEYMRQLTGKKIISDSGYGVVGDPEQGENQHWYNDWNVNLRVKDGIVAHTLVNENRNPPNRAKLC